MKELPERLVNALIAKTAALLAHDIESPMAAIKTYFALGEQEREARDEMKEHLLRRLQKTGAVLKKAADLRELPVVRCAPVALQELLAAACKRFWEQSGGMKIDLALSNRHKILCDDVWTIQLFVEFFEHVLISRWHLDRITVRAVEERSRLLWGRGCCSVIIPFSEGALTQDELSRFFDPFKNPDSNLQAVFARRWCREVMRLQRGDIAVQNTAEGACFRLRFRNSREKVAQEPV